MFSCGTIGLGITDQAAVLAIVHIDMPGLAGMQHARNGIAVLVLDINQHGGADRVEIPDIVGDILEVADIFAGVEIERHQRVCVEIVARTDGAVEIGRRVADHEEDPVRRQIDGRVLPDAATQGFRGIAVLGIGRFFSGDIAMHVAAGGVLLCPDARAVVGDRRKTPYLRAGLGIERLDEAANAVFAAIRADQHLAFNDGRRHRFAVAFFRIGDRDVPCHLSRFWHRARAGGCRGWRERLSNRTPLRRDCWGRSSRS